MQNYFNSIAYVDSALEIFVTAIQETDPNSLFIIFSDHCANIHAKEYKSYTVKGLEPVPLFILDPMNKVKKEILATGSTIDIGPTLFDYLGIEIPEFWQGKSLLDENSVRNTFILGAPYFLDHEGKPWKLPDRKIDTEELYRIQNYMW